MRLSFCSSVHVIPSACGHVRKLIVHKQILSVQYGTKYPSMISWKILETSTDFMITLIDLSKTPEGVLRLLFLFRVYKNTFLSYAKLHL